MKTRIVQISDTHLLADPEKTLLGVNTQASLQAVCEALLRQQENRPDVILLTGDLSQDHSEASYLRLVDTVRPLGAAIYYIPGNHDEVGLMNQLLPRHGILNDKHLIVNNWQIILLNSQKPGAVEGLLDERQLDFLQKCLRDHPQLETLIALHHHPVPVGSAWLDNLALKNAASFWQVVSQSSKVKVVLFGHVHQEHHEMVNGIHCYSTPSTCFQFMRYQAHFGLEKLPPGYRWINLHEDGTFETGVNRIATYVGTFNENAKGY